MLRHFPHFQGIDEAMPSRSRAWANDTVSYTYHGTVHRLRTVLSIQQPTASFAVTNAYDAARRLTGGTGAWGRHVFYHADGNGNVTHTADSSQTRAGEWRYDPYGRSLYSSTPVPNSMRFSSKLYHSNSGLYYYGYRFYDPNLQRWLNRDPIGELGGMNLYRYVCNSPQNMVDPHGELGVLPLCAIGAGMSFLWQLASEDWNIKCVDWTDVGISCLQSMTGYGVYANLKKMHYLTKVMKKAKQLKNARKRALDGVYGLAALQALKCGMDFPFEKAEECDE